jgi:DNA-binding response OmpR family regulator
MGKKIQVMALYEAKDDVSGLLSRLKDADEEIEIDVLSSVTDLIEKLQEDEYDCVLSDSCVQGLDAIELGKKVKELYNMPFFIYTIKESEELVFQALQEGIPYFNVCENKNAHKKLLKRIKFVAEKSRRRKNGDTLNYFDRPTVFVQGSDVYLIEDDGSETLWGSEGEDAEDVAKTMELEMKATNFVRNELARKVTELSDDLLQTDVPSAAIPDIVQNGYLKLSRWFKNTREFNKTKKD